MQVSYPRRMFIRRAASARSTIFPFLAGPLRTEIDRHAHRLFVYVMVDTCSPWSLEPGMLLDRWHSSDIGGDVFLAARRDKIRAKRPFLPLRKHLRQHPLYGFRSGSYPPLRSLVCNNM
jgi:hypothetical protein